MSWNIENLKNTVVITPEIAWDLYEQANDGRWDFGSPVTNDDVLDYGVGYWGSNGELRLNFNSDDMEHMDFVDDKAVQRILKKYKVKGDICFGSLEGDNAGSFWGYRFDGKGGMKKLTGKLVWK